MKKLIALIAMCFACGCATQNFFGMRTDNDYIVRGQGTFACAYVKANMLTKITAKEKSCLCFVGLHSEYPLSELDQQMINELFAQAGTVSIGSLVITPDKACEKGVADGDILSK